MDFLIQPDADGNCCGCDVKTDACTPCATGACCNDGTCYEGAHRSDCEAGGGFYYGDNSLCSSHPDCCGIRNLGVIAQGISCISTNGSSNTSSFLVNAGVSYP